MSGSDLFTGTLDLLVLRTIGESTMHGYAVGKSIRRLSEGSLDIEEGALYPALHRLERKGWLASSWGRTEANRRAKFYKLTSAGRTHLSAELERWSEFTEAVQAVISGRGS